MKVYFLLKTCTTDDINIKQDNWKGDLKNYTNKRWLIQGKTGPTSFRCWCRTLSDMYLNKQYIQV